jgi:hypothetical protein
VSALVIKTLEHLQTPAFENRMLSAQEALWLFCHLLGLTILLDLLDPKFISASELQISGSTDTAPQTMLIDPLWIDHILVKVPARVVNDNAATDVLALAFLKTVCGHFGMRGLSCISRVSLGHGHASLTEALWCEANMPASIVELGLMNKAKISALFEVKGHIKPACDMHHLATIMTLHGAQSFTWHLVHGEKMQTFFEARFVCSQADKREAVEAFLIKAGATKVSLSPIEQDDLNRRLVCLPLGHGNKNISVRFYEYTYYDKIVRAEPLEEDVEAYVQKTNYSVEVARSALFMAWKKWRGRIASE